MIERQKHGYFVSQLHQRARQRFDHVCQAASLRVRQRLGCCKQYSHVQSEFLTLSDPGASVKHHPVYGGRGLLAIVRADVKPQHFKDNGPRREASPAKAGRGGVQAPSTMRMSRSATPTSNFAAAW